MSKIKKAILPVGGLGTRFLPATKAYPKEMLPLVDKPLVQFAAEEAVKAGITQLIFITNHSKRAIEDHFDSSYELESRLAARDEQERLSVVKNILPHDVTCAYIRQNEPLGLGHAILSTRDIIGNEPFAVLLADDFIDSGEENCLSDLVKRYHELDSTIIAVSEVPAHETYQYGIVDVLNTEQSYHKIKRIIEKPVPGTAPSNLAVVGRYVLKPSIFDAIANTPVGKGGEVQLTDALSNQLQQESMYALEINGQRFDCGTKFGYLNATIHYGLRHPEVSENLKSLLQSLASSEDLA